MSKEVRKVLSVLRKTHQPTMLEHLSGYTPFQLLVATLLSSRTKDSVTLPLVKRLFQKCPRPEDLLNISLKELEESLYGIGFYQTKAKNVQKLSRIILDEFNGRIPDNFSQLVALPGVGRKTANCILNYAFQKPAIAVDTHVHRISNRLGWVKTKGPEETEKQLSTTVPKELWSQVNELLVDHGQRVCLPRNPRCSVCSVKGYCEFGKVNVIFLRKWALKH